MPTLLDAARRLSVPDGVPTGSWYARVIELEGFGGRRDGEFVMDLGGEQMGTILGGSGDAEIREAAAVLADRTSHSIVDVPVGDREAIDAGLACGGRARIIVQRIESIPNGFWAAIAQRRPVALITPLEADGPPSVVLDSEPTASVASPGDGTTIEKALHALRRAQRRQILETADGASLIECFLPDPRLVVLGVSALADAIAAQGSMLGWTTSVVDERGERSEAALHAICDEVREFGPLDGVVVLSHDIDASCAVLRTALQSGCGYVGALGSRHTQAARADRLRSLGMSESEIGSIHGPVGLDIGARTPEETALAIFAEALAVRSGRTASSLREGKGAING